MPADIQKAQELIDQLNEEIFQWGYQGHATENLDGDTRTLELHLEAPDGTQLDRPVAIILPNQH